MDEAVKNGTVELYDTSIENSSEDPKPSDNSSSTNITTRNDHHNLQSKQNQRPNETTVRITSLKSSDRKPQKGQNDNAPSNTSPQCHQESLKLNLENSRKIDTEIDAKPETPYPPNGLECEHLSFPNSKTEHNGKSPVKSEWTRSFENDVLNPKDQFDQRMTEDHLIDVVIVYAKSDYELAVSYQDWLTEVAQRSKLFDIKISLYTSEDFPSNDVRVVEEVVNRSMRVLMLLSENFTNEVSLTFIKEEAIGMTRLQELPTREQISLFATTIINRKKNSVRPVHTVSKKKRYYRTPVGLSALRAFEFFDNNPNEAYENDMATAFLKKAREDREFHTIELQRHQSYNNPCVFQVSRNEKGTPYLPTSHGACSIAESSSTTEKRGNNTFSAEDSNHSPRNVSPRTNDQRMQHPEDESHFSRKLQSTNNDEKILHPREGLETSEIVGPSMQKTTKSTQVSAVTSGFASDISYENVLIDKPDSLEPQQVQKRSNKGNEQSSLSTLSPSLRQPSTGNIKSHSDAYSGKSKDGLSTVETGDEEEDSSASFDKIKSKVPPVEDPNVTSLMYDSLLFEKKAGKYKDSSKTNIQSFYNKGEHITSKHKIPDDVGDVRQNIISYSEASGRSGIRAQARPQYEEYMAGVPNRQGTRHAVDDDTPDEYRQFAQATPPNRPPQHPHIPITTGPNSVHYHYHYPSVLSNDVDVDQGSLTGYHLPLNSGPPTLLRDRMQPPQPQPTVRSGPVFNIQGCATVQIGDKNKVVGNQSVEGTNNIRNSGSMTGDSDRTDSTSTRPDDEGIIAEPPQSYESRQEESQNVLSPGYISEKGNQPLNVSKDTSDDENSRDESNDDTFQSEEMFGGSNNDISMNLSVSIQDKDKTRKPGLDDELFVMKEKVIVENKSTNNSIERLKSISSSTVGESYSKESSVSSIELSSLTTCLRGSRKQGQYCLQHYSQHFRCQISCPDPVNFEDDID